MIATQYTVTPDGFQRLSLYLQPMYNSRMYQNPSTQFLSETELSLAHTLDCGQCFRWILVDDGVWEGIVRGRFFRLRQSDVSEPGSPIYADPSLNDYFDLTLDYRKIKEGLSCVDPHMALACRYAPGIRILRQEPWEALCSFIISQNNNIKRIRLIIERLSDRYGTPVAGTSRHAFPSAESLAGTSDEALRSLGTGFRASYILDAATKVANGEIVLNQLVAMPMDEARVALMRIHGVGPKVADCALLYGLHRLEAFPMDVWMKRVMASHFPDRDCGCFGRYAGIAQQYLFHLERTGGVGVKPSVSQGEGR